MAAKSNEECKAKSYMYEPKLEKKQVKLNSKNIYKTSSWFDLRIYFCSYIGLDPSDPA